MNTHHPPGFAPWYVPYCRTKAKAPIFLKASGSLSQVQRTPSKDPSVVGDGRGTFCDESSCLDEWRKARPPPQRCGCLI